MKSKADKLYYDVFTGGCTLSPDPYSIYDRYVPVIRGNDHFCETWQTNIRDKMLRIAYDSATAKKGNASHVRKLMANENGMVLHSMLSIEVPQRVFDRYMEYLTKDGEKNG